MSYYCFVIWLQYSIISHYDALYRYINMSFMTSESRLLSSIYCQATLKGNDVEHTIKTDTEINLYSDV